MKEFSARHNQDQDQNTEMGQRRIDNIWQNFEVEVKKLKELRHKNIVRLLGYKISGQTLSIFMPLYDSSLHTQIKKRQDENKSWFTVREMSSFFVDLCEGLTYIHSMKVAHLDLKVNMYPSHYLFFFFKK